MRDKKRIKQLRAELVAAQLQVASLGARLLEAIEATDEEKDRAQDLLRDMAHESEIDELAAWSGDLAEQILQEREWDDEDGK